MSLSRSKIREVAFLILFEKEFSNESIDEICEMIEEDDILLINDDIKEIVNGVLDNLETIDSIIEKYSQKRTIARIPKVNLTILRIAIYESIYSEKASTNIAISEAVLLAEEYAFESDVKFINGALGSFSRSDDNKELKKDE